MAPKLPEDIAPDPISDKGAAEDDGCPPGRRVFVFLIILRLFRDAAAESDRGKIGGVDSGLLDQPDL